jgi:hypothetical protein
MNRWTKSCVVVAACLATFCTGVALACDGNYCDLIELRDCVALDGTTEDSCCIDAGGGARRCATCTREMFMCMEGNDILNTAGPAYDCHDLGAACQ